MDVRAEEETEGGGEEEEEEEEEERRVRAGDLRADRQACLRGRRARKLTGPVRVPQVTCPAYERGPRTPAHTVDGVTIKLNAS